MPCTYYTAGEMEALAREAHTKQIKDLTEKLDRTTQMLCKLCSTLEQEKADWALPPEIRAWWQQHQETDRKRKAQERYAVAVRSLQGIKKTIQDIVELGGEPGKALKKALTEAERELAAASEGHDISSYNGNF